MSWIGRLIGFLDEKLNRENHSFVRRRLMGCAATALVLAAAAVAGAVVERVLALAPAPFGFLLSAAAGSTLVAQKSLFDHVRTVGAALESGGIEAGREAVARLVGRDVSALEAAGVRRAAIESLAENFSDGIVAPLLWIAAFGLPGGLVYKALNTADSMVGHRSARHEAFGFAAARLDDLANLLPARWAALCVIVAAAFTSSAEARAGARIVRRDHGAHDSPNSGWPEAAFAGALGLKFGGPRRYGKRLVEGHFIGDGRADATPQDLSRALALYRRACLVNWAALAFGALAFILWRG